VITPNSAHHPKVLEGDEIVHAFWKHKEFM